MLELFLVGTGAPFAAAEEPAPAAAPAPAPAPEPAPAPTTASGLTSVPGIVGSRLASDFRWSVNNLVADGEDIIKSPCHAGELLKNPSFYWTTLAAGAALGAGFALDEPARSEFRHISHKDSSRLQSWGSAALWGSTGALYLYGLTVDDARAREYALTGLLSTGVSGLLTSALKVTFGRERPVQNNGHWQRAPPSSSCTCTRCTPPTRAAIECFRSSSITASASA